MFRYTCMFFSLWFFLSFFSALAFTVTPIHDFSEQALVETPNTALFIIHKDVENLTVTLNNTRTGVSILCNNCSYWTKDCFIKLGMDTSVVKQISNRLNITNTTQVFHHPIKVTIIPNTISIAALLEYVAKGLEDSVIKTLNLNPSLVFSKGNVTDDAGRTFEQITAFQYALWAYDRHMWELLLKYLPLSAANDQLLELEQYGTAYEMHYNYKAFLDSFNTNDLGKMQRTVPIHIVNEYTRKDRHFYPTPNFKDVNLPRYDVSNIPACTEWYPIGVEPSSNYKMIRGEMSEIWPNNPPKPKDRFSKWYDKVDKAAMMHLFQIREKEYAMLKNQLHSSIQKDKRHGQ